MVVASFGPGRGSSPQDVGPTNEIHKRAAAKINMIQFFHVFSFSMDAIRFETSAASVFFWIWPCFEHPSNLAKGCKRKFFYWVLFSQV